MIKKRNIMIILLALASVNAHASSGQLPNLTEVVNNLLMLPNYILTSFRYFMILVSALGFFGASFLLWYSGQQASGNPPKFISIANVPATGNLLFVMFVSAGLYAFADGFFALSQMVKGVTGHSMGSPYSVVTYSENSSADALQVLAIGMLMSVSRIMSFVSFYLAFRELKKVGYNKSENSTAKIIGLVFAGTLIYDIIWTYDLFVNSFGLDILRFVF